MEWEQLLLWRLLIAIPEWEFDQEIARLLTEYGVLRWDAMELGEDIRERIARDARLGRRMRDKNLIQRILITMPEILTVSTVDWMRKHGLISVEIAHRLRIGLRAKDALAPVFVKDAVLATRLGALFSSIFSEETIDLLRDLDQARINRMGAAIRSVEFEKENWLQEFLQKETARLRLHNKDGNLSRADREWLDRIKGMTRDDIRVYRAFNIRVLTRAQELSIARAEMAKSIIRGSKAFIAGIAGIKRTSAEIKAADNAWDVMTILWSKILDDDVLKTAIRLGVISPSRYDAIRSLELLGMDIWTKVGKSFKYESWASRALLISEGIMSHEMLEALYQNGIIGKTAYRYMQPGVNAIRMITRSYAGRFRKSIRMRVTPAENPLGTFLRKTESTDRALLRLLAEAAQDAKNAALKLEKSALIGAKARAAQQRLIEKELYDSLHRVYENIGYLTIFGEKQASLAAADAMDTLTAKVWGSTKKMQDLQREFTRTARSGIESYVSRQENLVSLSRRIYNGGVYGEGVVKREINKALLRDLSPAEFAKRMESLFKPNAPGGVSYAAMRLARTEINNAFHYTQIRYTREMPWVQAYQWNRSGRATSRPHACSDYANQNNYDMGKGVFPKSEVPSKPHPQCLCFLTTVTMSNGEFERRLRTGAFNTYFQSVSESGYFEDAWAVDRRNVWLEYMPAIADTAKTAAIGQLASLVRAAFSL